MTYKQAKRWVELIGYTRFGLGTSIGPNPLEWVQHCVAFAKAYPIGANLTPYDFDAFAATRGILVIPPAGTAKGDDAWKGHLGRRFNARDRMNAAAINIFLMEQVDTVPFRIDVDDDGDYKVISALEVATDHIKIERVASLYDAVFIASLRGMRALPPEKMNADVEQRFVDYVEMWAEDRRHVLSVTSRTMEKALELKAWFDALPSPNDESDDGAA
jgi:hypothetical protein